MPVSGTARNVAAGLRGLDCNGVKESGAANSLTDDLLKAFLAAGYSFCVRYVPREAKAPTVGFDLQQPEAERILASGLGLMVVQHFPGNGWSPSKSLGRSYGAFAAKWARETAGLPDDVSLFCDMEGVGQNTPQKNVIEHCLAWHAEVSAAGFSPGLYLGDKSKLGGKTIAADLGMFHHYWRALREEFTIPGREFSLRQFEVSADSPFRPKGAKGFEFQRDESDIDPGGRPLRMLARG